MKQTFNLILTLVTMFTMAQTAWAATVKETRTTTWQMDGGASGSTTLENSLTLLNAEGERFLFSSNYLIINTDSLTKRLRVTKMKQKYHKKIQNATNAIFSCQLLLHNHVAECTDSDDDEMPHK